MKIKILALGKIDLNSPEGLLCSEYFKRIKYNLEVKQLNNDISQEKLSLELSKYSSRKDFLVCLDAEGSNFTSKEFSGFLQKTLGNFKNIIFLIGGDEGFTQDIKDRSNLLLSLGRMTYPHKIARILLFEQLYRAQTIIENHPYHK